MSLLVLQETHPPPSPSHSCSGCNSDLEPRVIWLSAVVMCVQATHCLKNNLYCLLMFWQLATTHDYYLNVLTFVRNKQEAIMALFEWICSLTKKVNKIQHIIMQGLVFACVWEVCVEEDIRGRRRRNEVSGCFCHSCLPSQPAKTLQGHDCPQPVTFLTPAHSWSIRSGEKNRKSSGAISRYLLAAVKNTKSVKVVCKLGVPVFVFSWVIIESTEGFNATLRECLCLPVSLSTFWSRWFNKEEK